MKSKLEGKKSYVSIEYDADPNGSWDIHFKCTREELAFAISIMQWKFSEWMSESKDIKIKEL